MHKIKRLKEKLLEELGEYSDKKSYSMEDVVCIKHLASAVDHMCNIVEDAEEEEYSSRSYDSGRMSRRSYDDGSVERSYDGDGYDDGRSGARGRGRNARRNSMGRYAGEGYSRDDEMVRHIRTIAMGSEDDNTRNELERLASRMSRM